MSELEVIKEDGIDLLDLISVLVKNIKWIIIVSGIFMVGILVYAIISLILPAEKSYMPNQFSSTSTVMLNSSGGSSPLDSIISSSGMGALAGIAGISGGSDGVSDSELAMKLVTTFSFLEKIDNEFDLRTVYDTISSDYPETKLKNTISEKLTLSVDEKTSLLKIKYTDIDKVLATDIVNKVTELLEEEFDKIDVVRNKNQMSIIEDKKVKVKIELNNLQNKILTFQKKYNLMDVNIVFQELMSQIAELQSQLLMKEVAIESYGQVSSIRDPGYLKLLAEQDAIKSAIKKIESGQVGNYPPISELPELSLELEFLKRELRVQATVYQSIITQLETLKLTSDGTGPTFQVLEKARVPEMKSGPSRGKLVIIVTLVGFFFSIFFVFVKEAILNIKNDPVKMKRLRGIK